MEQKRVDELRELYTHYRDTSYGSGGFSLSWGRKASEAILELLDELEKASQYEYAIGWDHKPTRMKGRLGGWGSAYFGWGSLDEADTELEVQKSRDADAGVTGDYEYKFLKRRLGGKIEDV